MWFVASLSTSFCGALPTTALAAELEAEAAVRCGGGGGVDGLGLWWRCT